MVRIATEGMTQCGNSASGHFILSLARQKALALHTANRFIYLFHILVFSHSRETITDAVFATSYKGGWSIISIAIDSSNLLSLSLNNQCTPTKMKQPK